MTGASPLCRRRHASKVASSAPSTATRAASGSVLPGGRMPSRWPRTADPMGSSMGTQPAARSSRASAVRSTWRAHQLLRLVGSANPRSSSANQPGSVPWTNVTHGRSPASTAAANTSRAWSSASVSTTPGRGSSRAHSTVMRTSVNPRVAVSRRSSAWSMANPAPSPEVGTRPSRSQRDQSAVGATPSADRDESVTPHRKSGWLIAEEPWIV